MQNLPIELREKILFDHADIETKKVLRQVCTYYRHMVPMQCACCVIVCAVVWVVQEFLLYGAEYLLVNGVEILTRDEGALEVVIRDVLMCGDRVEIEFIVSHRNITGFFEVADTCKRLFYNSVRAVGGILAGSSFSGTLEINEEPILLRTVFNFERCMEINVYDPQSFWLDHFVVKFE